MNTTTFSDSADDLGHDQTSRFQQHRETPEPHLVVQILSVIAFGVISIVAISMAFHAFWLAGFVLTVVIAWTWAGSRTFGGRHNWADWSGQRSIIDLAPVVSKQRSTGNSSFDAYRSDMLERLEQESRDFKSFLTRLREARDATEFDQFMDDRAKNSGDTDSSVDKVKDAD